ncbi:MAG: hypothetical protein ACRCUS_05040 [Anaerovoracaceae bacterium]
MNNNQKLKSKVDYSEGQRKAAHMILLELSNLFNEYADDILVVGGWVPDLMFPKSDHIGSIDVDLLINQITLKDPGYMTLSKILRANNYEEHPDKYFSFIKTVNVEEIEYLVDVDILAGMYGGTMHKKKSQHVQGLKALKATGGDFAFNFPAQKVKAEGKRGDGAIDTATVNVIAVVPFLVMKTAALGRGKAKDAYDIYFILKNYDGGIDALSLAFETVKSTDIIQSMIVKLREKFASVNHSGPKDVSDFMDLSNNEEIDRIKRDAFERVNALIEKMCQ